jgi:hypothetical protein
MVALILKTTRLDVLFPRPVQDFSEHPFNRVLLPAGAHVRPHRSGAFIQ